MVSNYVYHNITGADKHELLLETLRVLKKGGVFALNDEMKPRMYGDMEAFAQRLRDMGYQEVRLMDTAKEAFGSRRRAALMMLGDSRLLVGRKVTRAKHLFREENMSLEEFRRKYPAQTMTLGNGKPFTYRYYRNPKAAATAVLLTGGIGLSDLFYRHFEWFARDFSVLAFDYQIQFADNGEFFRCCSRAAAAAWGKGLAGRPVPGRRGGPGHRLSASGGGGRAGTLQHLLPGEGYGR